MKPIDATRAAQARTLEKAKEVLMWAKHEQAVARMRLQGCYDERMIQWSNEVLERTDRRIASANQTIKAARALGFKIKRRK